jgi:hypothetical protein
MRMMNNQLNVIPKASAASSFARFDSSCGDSLSSLMGKRVIFRTDFSKDAIPLQNLSRIVVSSNSCKDLREFSRIPKERTVASIDSSCALIGETEDGTIYAGRVATVTANKGSILRYRRVGPIIFYFDPFTVASVLSRQVSRKITNALLLDSSLAERFIRNHLERKAQIEAASSLSEAIIVVDGALRPSVLEQGDFTLGSLERACEENRNQLIGFCKASSLRKISDAIPALKSNQRAQLFLDLTDSINPFFSNRSANRVSAVKFSQNSQIFRVDFSSSNFENEAQLLADLQYNDCFFRGYPETLRMAHHLSVFDSSTISSVRSYLAKKYDLVQVPSDDLRASILGKLV